MTIKLLLQMVDELDAVSAEMRRVMESDSPAYRLLPDGFRESTAVHYARRAGHLANQLIDLAERGERTAA